MGAARATGTASLARVDGVLSVFLPLVESRGEYHIACGAGCNACCANFVRASVPEALVAAEWLAQPEQAPVLARFREKLPVWRATGGDDLPALEQLLARHGGSPTEGPDWETYNRIGMGYAQRNNQCPFNEAGRCELYPVRPSICRAVYVLDTAEYCVPGRGQSPKQVSHPKLVEAMQTGASECSEAAVELGEPAYERALPEAIERALKIFSRFSR